MFRLLPLVMRDFSAIAERIKRKALLYAIACLLALGVYVLLIAGVTLMIAETQGMIIAVFAVAGILAATAMVIVAIAAILDRRDRRRSELDSTRNLALATLLATALPVTGRKGGLLALAAVGGAAALFFASGGGTRNYADRT